MEELRYSKKKNKDLYWYFIGSYSGNRFDNSM